MMMTMIMIMIMSWGLQESKHANKSLMKLFFSGLIRVSGIRAPLDSSVVAVQCCPILLRVLAQKIRTPPKRNYLERSNLKRPSV